MLSHILEGLAAKYIYFKKIWKRQPINSTSYSVLHYKHITKIHMLGYQVQILKEMSDNMSKNNHFL